MQMCGTTKKQGPFQLMQLPQEGKGDISILLTINYKLRMYILKLVLCCFL